MESWLGWASQGYEMHYCDFEAMGSNSNQVELGVIGTSV